MKNISLEWLDDTKFKATTDNEFSFELIGNDKKGITPVEYHLGAIAGCTAIDVITMLDRSGIFPDSFKVEISGKRKETHPKIFENINIIYKMKGKDIPPKKVRLAVRASSEKYCSVSLSMKDEIQMAHELYVNGEKIL